MKDSKTEPNLVLKYSKSSAFYLDVKKAFFLENDKLRDESLSQNTLYRNQPMRLECKLCASALPNQSDFYQHGVEYVFCDQCGHLNGRHEDTREFTEELYISNEGEANAQLYLDEDYSGRIEDIYLPKVDFLLSSLPHRDYSLLDIGCGGGYFVCAALQRAVRASGIDVNRTLVDFGNSKIAQALGQRPLSLADEEGLYQEMETTGADILSALDVLEHLREPQRFFTAFQKSRAQYLFYSVPMFSLSVFWENLFPEVFPRLLAGGHTHLFTESSLLKLNSLLGVQPIAQWRFGTDMMDLYRSCLVTLEKKNVSKRFLDFLQKGLGNRLDELQAVLDRNHFCSQIHCVAKKADESTRVVWGGGA